MKKDAGISTVLNAVWPGLGWLYAEELEIGIVIFIVDVCLKSWFITCLFGYRDGSVLLAIGLIFAFWITQLIRGYHVVVLNNARKTTK